MEADPFRAKDFGGRQEWAGVRAQGVARATAARSQLPLRDSAGISPASPVVGRVWASPVACPNLDSPFHYSVVLCTLRRNGADVKGRGWARSHGGGRPASAPRGRMA